MHKSKQYRPIITVFCIIFSIILSSTPILVIAKNEQNEVVPTASVQSLQGGIKCDVNFMYDGAYSESIMKHGKQLKIPLKITNTSGKKENIICYIAEYDTTMF